MSNLDRERRLQRVATGVRGLPVSDDAVARMVRAGDFDTEPGFAVAWQRFRSMMADLLGQPMHLPVSREAFAAALVRGQADPDFVKARIEAALAFARVLRDRCGHRLTIDDEGVRRLAANYNGTSGFASP
jgi:hypothetical protein